MNLTKDQVKHVAKLANLPITQEEEDKYAEQLSQILDYVAQLKKVDTKEVEPTFNVSSQMNIQAHDEEGDCNIAQDKVLTNAAKALDGFFVTKGVFNEDN